MPLQQITIASALGLNVQANSFSVPDGSFEQAENVVFANDGIIRKRRGFSTLTAAATMTNPTTLLEYLGFLFVCQNNLISRVNTSTGALTSLSGAMTINAGSKARSAKANGNLYVATADGVRKLESSSATVLQAGIPRGLDLDISTNSAVRTGVLKPNDAVGYRVLFGRLDANSNKVIGAPSEISTRSNAWLNGVTQASYTFVTTTVTVNLTGVSALLSVSDTVVISGATGTNPPNGTWTVASVVANSFTFVVTSAPTSTGTLNFGVFRTPILEFSLPSEATTEYFYQVYRTTQPGSSIATVSDDGQLIFQANVLSAQVTAKFITFTDTINELFKDASLYTNSSQEGIAKSNLRPPFATDIAVFQDCMFFGNTASFQSLNLAIVTVAAATFAAADFIEIKQGATTRRYIATTSAPTAGFTGVSSAVTWNFGYPDASGFSYFQLTNSTSTTISSAITATAKSLCKAINRDSSSPCNGYYLSSGDALLGQFLLQSRTLAGVAFSVRANTDTSASAFSPLLPASFSAGTQVTSNNSTEQNAVYFSKPQQPEAVPGVYTIPVGAKTSAIIRIVALRDSLLVIKADGLFVIRGNSPSTFSVQQLDSTIICVAADSVSVLNNSVYMLSNQGVVAASDAGAQVLSRNIETLFTAIIGKSNIATETNAVSYESERLYLLSTMNPNSNSADVVYCFNTVTSAWSTWTNTFNDSIVLSSDDKLYVLGNVIAELTKERKLQNRLDFAEKSFAGSSAIIITPLSCELSFTIPVAIEVNDSIFHAATGTINQILSISSATGTPIYTFRNPVSWIALDVLELFKPIRSAIKTSPLTLGDVSRWKQFSEFIISFRNRTASALTISFSNDSSGTSIDTAWSQNNSAQSGWGFEWGSLWGGDSINSVLTTQASQPARTYVPVLICRGTFIQGTVVHSVAAESCEIQSLSYSARAYSPRVSK